MKLRRKIKTRCPCPESTFTPAPGVRGEFIRYESSVDEAANFGGLMMIKKISGCSSYHPLDGTAAVC
jgi:hypothetical protein